MEERAPDLACAQQRENRIDLGRPTNGMDYRVGESVSQ